MKARKKTDRSVRDFGRGSLSGKTTTVVSGIATESRIGERRLQTKSEKFNQQLKKWVRFYRLRPDVFAEHLGIHLTEYEAYLLYEMFHNNYFAFFAARGLGKTWLITLFCMLAMTLYPGVKIVVAAGVRSQAIKIVTEKMPMILESAPLLKREILKVTASFGTPEPNLVWKNGSTLIVVAANENARSNRANILILDEFVQIKPYIYSTVLRRFLSNPRHPGFLDKPEYKDYPLERNKEIYLTSPYYKSNWSYGRYKVFLHKMIEGKKYGVCVLPYQMGIYSHLFSKEQLMDELTEGDRDPIAFSMEMDALFYGQSSSAFFQFDLLNNARQLPLPIYPERLYGLVSKNKKLKRRAKHPDEIRVLCIDVAVVSGTQNDASAFLLMRLIPDKKGYLRQFCWGETHVGMNTVEQSLLIRRLYYDLDCDYIVLDRANAGVAIYTNLTYPLVDKDRGVEYEPWTSMNEKDMQDLCAFDDAKPIIYTISATPASNDAMARNVRDLLMRNPPRITFLGGREAKQELLELAPEINLLSKESQAEFMLPFEETDCLINEMVQLECKLESQGGHDLIKLTTIGKQRKDRYTAMGYGNEFANYLERQRLMNGQDTELLDFFNQLNSGFSHDYRF